VPGTEVAAAGVPGLYGKVPARGDFVSRRLSPEFIDAWDAWQQSAISESRRRLGVHWLDFFLSAPVWRFVVPAGMFSKAGWAGVLLPSVDRVGRYFPLTLAAPLLEERLNSALTLMKALPWLERLEAAALEALVPDLDLERFERGLAELTVPAEVLVALPFDDDTVPLGPPPEPFEVWPCAPNALLKAPALARRASSALWMSAGGDSAAPAIAACAGAIPGERFCALLDGRWSEHGWTVLDPKLYCDPQNPGVDLIHGQGMQGGEVPPLAASPSSNSGAQVGARVGEGSSS
jgi:type VI secretion system protein ImpM